MDQCIQDAGDSKMPAPPKPRKVASSRSTYSDSHNAHLNVRLPQLDLRYRFDGSIINWKSFWDKHQVLIGDADIPAVTKFSYFSSILEGEARQVIQALSITERQWYSVWTSTGKIWSSRKNHFRAHTGSVVTTLQVGTAKATAAASHVSSLWQLQDTLLSHVRTLVPCCERGRRMACPHTSHSLSPTPRHTTGVCAPVSKLSLVKV